MKLITSLMVVLILSACGERVTTPTLEPVKTTIKIVPAPKPLPVSLKPVEFKVITHETKQILDTQRVWYAITVNSYENLAFNTQELLRVIREQKAAIRYYEGLYTTSK
jgi:hypothetical protein